MTEQLHWNKKYVEQLSAVERKKFSLELKIIKYLYVNGAKTNAEICSHLKISSPSSIAILNELICNNLIEKQGKGDSNGGRKPDLFGIKDNALYVLGMEVGKYETKMAVFNATNAFITDVVSYPILLDNDLKTIDALYNHASDLIKSSGIDPSKLMAVGISIPGLVNSSKGINYTYLNFEGTTMAELLQKKFDRPVFVENDAKAIALAEYRFGLAKGKKNVLSIFLDWGIGLGLIVDGKLYRGSLGLSGEFGHIPMIEDGILCTCGKQGCLETVASGTALSRLAMEGIKAGKTSIVMNRANESSDKVDASLVVQAAHNGDQYAINILAEVGNHLGKGLSILIQLFNPELIILGGKIAEAGDYITTPIQQSLNKYCIRQLKESSPVITSEMKQNIGLMGTIAVIMENIFEYFIKTSAKKR